MLIRPAEPHRDGAACAAIYAPFVRDSAVSFEEEPPGAACAGITLPNPASVALHEALGFELVGVYCAIGFKAGAWRDVAWWQRRLRAPGDRAPEHPGTPVVPRCSGEGA